MITISTYDPAWPEMFRAEAVNIQTALGPLALRIEHVGSTAVPGLAAKPVIDIQVSVATLKPLSLYLEKLSSIDYTHFPLGDFDLVYPFFQKPADWPCTHHLHLCVSGSVQERQHLAFRDYLRLHPEAAKQYVELKRKLASQHHGRTLESRERYSLSKTEFVTSVLQRSMRANATSA